jgi:hypothetical protein
MYSTRESTWNTNFNTLEPDPLQYVRPVVSFCPAVVFRHRRDVLSFPREKLGSFMHACMHVCMYVCMYVYEVSTAVNVHSVIDSVVTLLILVSGLQYFRETDCLHLQGRHTCSESAGIDVSPKHRCLPTWLHAVIAQKTITRSTSVLLYSDINIFLSTAWHKLILD